jgi:predicted DNA-binding ribbon-helix-helix protein
VALGWRSPGVGTPLNRQALEKSPRLAIVRAGMMSSSLVKHSVRVAGHATSVSLETAFWEALCEIAQRRRMSVNAL